MKEWPKDGKYLPFRELVRPVRAAVEFAYRLERTNVGRDIPWDGPNVGKDTLVCAFSPAETLLAGNLKYSEEEQDRDPLTEIIGVAVQLGIEQGRRMAAEKLDSPLTMIEQGLEIVRTGVATIRRRNGP